MSVRTSYVSFPTAATPSLVVAGRLNTIAPAEDAAPTPGVVICHGSDGVDGRGQFHAEALNAAGIATLEIDMWAARGALRGAAGRPRSPVETVADAFAARAFLAAQPEVAPNRIGVMGFSWGGVVTLLAATAEAQPPSGAEPAFAAHVALYPVCWAYEVAPGLSLVNLTGAPVLIQTGDADAYDDPDGLDQLLARLPQTSRSLIRGITHAGAGHGFDRDLPAQTINDPFAHKGRGGPVRMAFHPQAAKAAREATVAFFTEALGQTAQVLS
jgi:dienelactone hydrolase